MWFGMQEGFNCFDGYIFEVYMQELGCFIFFVVLVKDIFEDLNCVLWIGIEGGGFSCFERVMEMFIYFCYDLLDFWLILMNKICVFFEDFEGCFYVGMDDVGFVIFDCEIGIFFREFGDDFVEVCVQYFFEMCDGLFWVLFVNFGLICFDMEWNFVEYFWVDILFFFLDRFYLLFEEIDGDFWVGMSEDGVVVCYVDGLISCYVYDFEDLNSFFSNDIWDFFQDVVGIVWVGIDCGVVCYMDDSDSFFVDVYNFVDFLSLGYDCVIFIYQDWGEVVWIGIY